MPSPEPPTIAQRTLRQRSIRPAMTLEFQGNNAGANAATGGGRWMGESNPGHLRCRCFFYGLTSAH